MLNGLAAQRGLQEKYGSGAIRTGILRESRQGRVPINTVGLSPQYQIAWGRGACSQSCFIVWTFSEFMKNLAEARVENIS